MYTEENEFNYDDYLDEADNYNSKKPFIDFKFILKIFLIIILIILIIFLVFKIKNKNYKNNNNDDNNNSAVVLVDNMTLIREAAYKYFFTNDNLPSEISESKSVSISELIKEELVTDIKDKDGNKCGNNISKATITKNSKDYELKINLVCAKTQSEQTYYYDLKGNCLTCNGESYTSSVSINDEDENTTNNETKTNSNNNSNNSNVVAEPEEKNDIDDSTNDDEDDNSKNNTHVCTSYSAWTKEYKTDQNLERETRTLVKAYKNNIVYGEWSNETTDVLVGNSNLEVRTTVKSEPVTSESCSAESTTKPESRDGRVITSRTETHFSTKKVCSGGKTYTKTLTKWDSKAYSCRSYGIGKVICTYKTKRTCKNKTTTSNTTYYKYCDTTTTNVNKTYYQSRTISYKPVYTD